jgi:cytochrome b561
VKSSESTEPNARPKDRVRYTHIAMLLHWAIALLIIANIALGLSAALLPTSILSDTGARVVIDKSIGITVLGHFDPGFQEQLHTQLGTLHTVCGYALFVVLALHILGALKHQWIDRHSVLGRMLP